MTRRALLLVFLTLTAGCATTSNTQMPAAQPPADALAAPDIRVGDVWIDKVDGPEKTMRIESATDSTLVVNLYGVTVTTTKDGNTITGYSSSRREIIYDPYLDTFSFPLQAGKKWSSNWGMIVGQYRGAGYTEAKAGVWKTITVPAGTFRTLRVDVRHSWSWPGGGDSGSLAITYWYAPEVNRFVKYKGPLGNVELVSYRPVPR